MTNELAKQPSAWLWVADAEAKHEKTKWQIDAAEFDLDEALCSFVLHFQPFHWSAVPVPSVRGVLVWISVRRKRANYTVEPLTVEDQSPDLRPRSPKAREGDLSSSGNNTLSILHTHSVIVCVFHSLKAGGISKHYNWKNKNAEAFS